ncbi:uncharacterized protein [Branchiostoma lanceolatum]|uniref:uncharacterized protein n=1 Tax=Branchiostoma lanceolatum TaxID=7740 RepID=UPI003452D3B9
MDHARKSTRRSPREKGARKKTDDSWTEENLRERMGKTSSSTELDLSHKCLRRIPSAVFSLKDVELLDVSDNPLGSIPVNIASLTNLKELRAVGCDVREVSGNISRCTYLSRVDFSRNPRLAALPASMKQLRYLKRVALSGCELKSLPENLTLLAAVETLDLSQNELTSLPPGVSALKRVRVLILSDNAFESIPDSVQSLGRLACLEIKRNRLNNSRRDLALNVPSNLKTLDMEGNCSLKLLPEGLENLANFEELNASYCGLETLLDSIGNLTSIRRLHLAGNKFRALPASFGNLLNLETLDLEGNRRLASLPLSLYHLRETLRDKQTGTNIGLILDSCPALALPESEVSQGNVVSVLVELMSDEILDKATVGVAAEVVEDTIMEGLADNMAAVTEGRVWDDLVSDVTGVVLADMALSEDIFLGMVEEVMPGLVKEVIIESVSEEKAMAIITGELLEETTRSVTEEVAADALRVDDRTREVIEELLEEGVMAMAEEVTTGAMQLDVASWKVMEALIEEAKTLLLKEIATSAVKVDAGAWEVMEELVEEGVVAPASEVAICAVQVDAVAWGELEQLLGEVTKAMTKRVVANAVKLDAVAWEVMQAVLREITGVMTEEVATSAVQLDAAAWKVMQGILEEVPAALTKEFGVATEAVRLDGAAWGVMEEMMEEAKRRMTEEAATHAAQVDSAAWEVMGKMLMEVTKATARSVAWEEHDEWHRVMEVMEGLVDEISMATARSVSLEVDEELRLGDTVPDEYNKQFTYRISAAAPAMQYLDLPAGVRLAIPRGATRVDTSVISAVLNPHGCDQTVALGDEELLVSDILEMRPAGLRFARPVALTIPHALPRFHREKEYVVKTSGDSGQTWRNLSTRSQHQSAQHFATVEVSHFSEFAVVARPLERYHSVGTGQPSVLRSSPQTDVQIEFPRDCGPQQVGFKVLPVDAETLTCAAAAKDGIGGIRGMSHIVKFCKNLLLSSPATVVLPLSPGDRGGRVRVLSCDDSGRWEDITNSVEAIVLQGSKVAFRTDRSAQSWLRCCQLRHLGGPYQNY